MRIASRPRAAAAPSCQSRAARILARLRHEPAEQVDVLVVDPLDALVLRIDTFFFCGRRRSAAALLLRRSRAISLSLSARRVPGSRSFARGQNGSSPNSSRLSVGRLTPLAAPHRRRCRRNRPAAALVARDRRGRPPEAGTVGHDLHDAALAVVGLPAPLLEAAGDQQCEPFASVSDTFSAISRQHTTLKKLVCSSHSLLWRFCQRRLTATPKLARRHLRCSGSRSRGGCRRS